MHTVRCRSNWIRRWAAEASSSMSDRSEVTTAHPRRSGAAKFTIAHSLGSLGSGRDGKFRCSRIRSPVCKHPPAGELYPFHLTMLPSSARSDHGEVWSPAPTSVAYDHTSRFGETEPRLLRGDARSRATAARMTMVGSAVERMR